MATASNNEIFDRLGQLTATMKAISDHLERQDKNSAVSRANMHRRLDEVVDRVGDLESDMSQVKLTTAGVKEVTDEVRQWKQRGLGALGVIGIAGAVLGGATVWFWGQILQALRGG
ncbi:MAG: DUF1515 domain-containing protein [Mesorhizobium sp.]|nr:MAG: DUF1515 domain-containing protein [Mesorhizobium sp.]